MKKRCARSVIWSLILIVFPWMPAAKAGSLYVLQTQVKVAPLPGAKLVEIWVPLPGEDPFQKLEGLSVSAPMAFQVTTEPEYGNRFVYLRKEGPLPKGAEIRIEAKVWREEVAPGPWEDPLPVRFLLSDRLVPVSAFADLAREITAGKKGQVAKLRAIYDYVVSHLRYNKTGQGWGRGDALWACSHKRGNCTDFHSLLMAMARAVGIPVVFEMGLPVPREEGQIKGYHCWLLAFPKDRVYGLDASEAAKHPEKREYFFGHLCENRILLTRGRDLLLSPAQHGGRLNFLYRAYMEVDLKPAPEKIQTVYRVERLSETP